MASVFTEPFTGAGALSADWAGVCGEMERISNQCYVSDWGTARMNFSRVSKTGADPADAIVTAKLYGDTYLAARVNYGSSAWRCYVLSVGGSSVYLYRVNNMTTFSGAGNWTLLTSYNNGSSVAGLIGGLHVSGNSITIYLNGQTRGTTITDANYATGQGAIGCYGNAVYVADDFDINSLVASQSLLPLFHNHFQDQGMI